MKRELVTLHGRVQGVGFRERVIEIARGHAVAGTVRNVTAGRALEIDVEGEPGAVDAFVAAVVAKRPYFARVEHLDRRPLEPRGIAGFDRAPTG
jgi:hydrogenase maturation factor HypF (carbamoyltransferase family)